MRVAGFAARHARAIVFGVAFTTLAGIYALTVLPSGIYPEAEFPRIAVIAHSGDLSPQMMTVGVTRPLEEAARGVLGTRRVRSKTIRGATEISVLFSPDADMQQALQLMQGRVDEARQSLPPQTEIVIERMTPTVFPILSFNLTGQLPAVDLADIARFDLRPLLSRIPGVGRVDVAATDQREVSVIVNPERLNAAKLTLGPGSRSPGGQQPGRLRRTAVPRSPPVPGAVVLRTHHPGRCEASGGGVSRTDAGLCGRHRRGARRHRRPDHADQRQRRTGRRRQHLAADWRKPRSTSPTRWNRR